MAQKYFRRAVAAEENSVKLGRMLTQSMSDEANANDLLLEILEEHRRSFGATLIARIRKQIGYA